jgi:hypothetical protein
MLRSLIPSTYRCGTPCWCSPFHDLYQRRFQPAFEQVPPQASLATASVPATGTSAVVCRKAVTTPFFGGLCRQKTPALLSSRQGRYRLSTRCICVRHFINPKGESPCRH